MVKKTLAILGSLLALITGFYTIDAHYAKSDDLKEHKQETSQSLSEVVKEFKLSLEREHYLNLSAQINNQKKWIMKFPNDVDARSDLEELKERRILTEQRIKELEQK